MFLESFIKIRVFQEYPLTRIKYTQNPFQNSEQTTEFKEYLP